MIGEIGEIGCDFTGAAGGGGGGGGGGGTYNLMSMVASGESHRAS